MVNNNNKSGKQLTIFQRMGKVFGPEGVKVPQEKTNRYTLGNKELLRTQSKSELEQAKLQAQQNLHLSNTWRKVEGEMYQQSIHYETTRIASYSDFESMEFFPEIAAALDIMMEESTTPNDKGVVLNIHSSSKRVKQILEDLFFHRLELHTNLAPWSRNLCKYGDNFVFLNIDDKAGVIGCRQMPNFEMERRDGDIHKALTSRNDGGGQSGSEYDNKIKFFWKTKDIEFNSWQIAHFRLLGDDRKLPYGTSFLEKARRIWKQLLLSEDAMLVYRVTRAPERRIYKVFVGNIDDADVEAYVNSIADRFKRAPVIDPQTGQIDLRFNQMGQDQDIFVPVRDENAQTPIDTLPGACIALDTRIPLLDGRTLELNEIINEWGNGNRNLWVYSVNPETGESAPGQITWAGETRKNANTLTITLDNGEKLTTTPDHKWVHRTKGFVEAQDLVVGDSLMPFYRDTKKIKKNTNEYERIWDTAKQEWVFTHRMVTDFMGDRIKTFVHDDEYIKENKKIETEKNYNHKIVKIEIGEIQDTGTITVDGNELLHNYHTFACESGVYVKNSNLDAIADIEYLQNKLFTALRIPKPFLGFDSAIGDGKNLAIQDIRFSRTINRIQQALVMELNKIAIIHLYLLGLEDDLDNFTLTLNNPSTQAEMLKVEHLQEKINLYTSAVIDAGNGFAPMSMTRAKRDILNMSDDEIKQDLLEQRIEKAAAAELAKTSAIIKRTGFFDKVDNIYADPEALAKADELVGDEDEEGGNDIGGVGNSFGGGGDMDFGEEGDEEDIDLEDAANDLENLGNEGAEDLNNEDLGETIKKVGKLLGETKRKYNVNFNERVIKHQNNYFNRLLGNIQPEKNKIQETSKLTNNALKFNDKVNDMINAIDKKLEG